MARPSTECCGHCQGCINSHPLVTIVHVGTMSQLKILTFWQCIPVSVSYNTQCSLQRLIDRFSSFLVSYRDLCLRIALA